MLAVTWSATAVLDLPISGLSSAAQAEDQGRFQQALTECQIALEGGLFRRLRLLLLHQTSLVQALVIPRVTLREGDSPVRFSLQSHLLIRTQSQNALVLQVLQARTGKVCGNNRRL